ncbi:MAG: hypothetical protein ACLQU2_31530 [Candidatus Binataceae bacterium]
MVKGLTFGAGHDIATLGAATFPITICSQHQFKVCWHDGTSSVYDMQGFLLDFIGATQLETYGTPTVSTNPLLNGKVVTVSVKSSRDSARQVYDPGSSWFHVEFRVRQASRTDLGRESPQSAGRYCAVRLLVLYDAS